MGVLKHKALQEIEKPLIVSREANVFSVLFTVVFFHVFPRQSVKSHVGSRLQAPLCEHDGCRLCRGLAAVALTEPNVRELGCDTTQAQAGPDSHADTANSQ